MGDARKSGFGAGARAEPVRWAGHGGRVSRPPCLVHISREIRWVYFSSSVTRTWWDPQAANTTEGSTYPPHASLSLVCFWVPIRPWAPKAGRVGTTGRPPTRLHMSSHKKSDPPQMTPPCAARRRGISRRQKFQSGGVGSQMSLWVVRPVEAGAQVKTAHARGRAGGVPGENKFREAAQIRFFAYGLQKRICP